jgi:hypothetical protein
MWATSFAANIASKTWLAYWVSSAVVNWVVFHVWMNTFHNLNHWEIFDENWNINWKKVGEWNLNVKELAKSIVFMWMLHWFNSSFIRWIWEKIKNWVPWWKYLFFSEILIETCSLIWISIWTELVFWEDYKEILSSLTPEEFFKLLALIIVMKQMDKWLKTIKLKKNNDWSIDIGEMEKI